VLEDGQRKLAEVWRSPAGTAYLAEMGRVVEAMRATSEAARHNDQVMSAVADALDARQKDFGVLSRAPMPADARERYARAIVRALDEDYHQAVANFRPVPAIGPSFQYERPLDPTPHDKLPTSNDGSSATTQSSRSIRTTSGRLPSWVPTQPSENLGQTPLRGDDGSGIDAATEAGPALQSMGRTPPASPSSTGPWPNVDPHVPGRSPGAGNIPGADEWSGPSTWSTARAPSTGLSHPTRAWRDLYGQPSPRGLAQPHRSGPNLPPEPGASLGNAASGRSPVASQQGSLVGGLPVAGSAGSAGRPWSGYRRRPEPFPSSVRHTVPPVIAPGAPEEEEPGPDQVATDYVDDLGNRITIRRPRD
jgi:hypothetical protein